MFIILVFILLVFTIISYILYGSKSKVIKNVGNVLVVLATVKSVLSLGERVLGYADKTNSDKNKDSTKDNPNNKNKNSDKDNSNKSNNNPSSETNSPQPVPL